METSTIEFSSNDTAEHLNGLQSSVDVINSIINTNEKTQKAVDTMNRNVQHITIMCNMKHIKNSGANLIPFITAASNGLEWLSHFQESL